MGKSNTQYLVVNKLHMGKRGFQENQQQMDDLWEDYFKIYVGHLGAARQILTNYHLLN